jgi:cation diffusion facilitator CzcD-associated flavoprotein CzcO
VPTPLLQLKGLPWKPETPNFVNHTIILEYIQSVATKRDLEKEVLYNTRVERVWKERGKWQVQSTTLTETEVEGLRKTQTVRVRDAASIQPCVV